MSDAALFVKEDCSEEVFKLREKFLEHYYDDDVWDIVGRN